MSQPKPSKLRKNLELARKRKREAKSVETVDSDDGEHVNRKTVASSLFELTLPTSSDESVTSLEVAAAAGQPEPETAIKTVPQTTEESVETEETVDTEERAVEPQETVEIDISAAETEETADIEERAVEPQETVEIDIPAVETEETVDIEEHAVEPQETVDIEEHAVEPQETVEIDIPAVETEETVDIEEHAAEPQETVDIEDPQETIETEETAEIEERAVETEETEPSWKRNASFLSSYLLRKGDARKPTHTSYVKGRYFVPLEARKTFYEKYHAERLSSPVPSLFLTERYNDERFRFFVDVDYSFDDENVPPQTVIISKLRDAYAKLCVQFGFGPILQEISTCRASRRTKWKLHLLFPSLILTSQISERTGELLQMYLDESGIEIDQNVYKKGSLRAIGSFKENGENPKHKNETEFSYSPIDLETGEVLAWTPETPREYSIFPTEEEIKALDEAGEEGEVFTEVGGFGIMDVTGLVVGDGRRIEGGVNVSPRAGPFRRDPNCIRRSMHTLGRKSRTTQEKSNTRTG